MPGSVDVSSFTRAAKALAGADKEIKKAVRAGLNRAAKPIGQAMVDGLAGRMPRRGGLSVLVAGARPTIRSSGSGDQLSVRITFRAKAGAKSLGALDAGSVRHPVFGNRKTWRTQHVPAGGARDALEAARPNVRQASASELDAAFDTIAKKGSS